MTAKTVPPQQAFTPQTCLEMFEQTLNQSQPPPCPPPTPHTARPTSSSITTFMIRLAFSPLSFVNDSLTPEFLPSQKSWILNKLCLVLFPSVFPLCYNSVRHSPLLHRQLISQRILVAGDVNDSRHKLFVNQHHTTDTTTPVHGPPSSLE